MNQSNLINIGAAKRVVCVMLAALLLLGASPWFLFGHAAAATQLQHRSIQMSDSSPSGGTVTSGVGSGTGVTYKVSFESFTAASSLIVDFCAEDPIINDTCSSPAGMRVTSATLQTDTTSGETNLTSTGWTMTTSDSSSTTPTNPRLTLTKGGSGTPLAPNVQHTFDVVGVTNPTTTGSFYARIYTFATTGTPGYTTAAGGVGTSYVDYGGIALSTAALITITARVQETLQFCVSKAAPSTWATYNCSDPQVTDPTNGVPAVTLGHGTGTPVISTTQIDEGEVYSQLSTNATYGAVINMHDSNTCGGLSADSGTTCAIPAIGTCTGTACEMQAGTAAFGTWVDADSVSGAGTVGTVAPTTAYNDGTHTSHTTGGATDYFGMDNAKTVGLNSSFTNQSTYNGSVGDATNGVFGSTVAVSSGPVYKAYDDYIFGATSSLTTPAGIYTANLSLIASGTF